MAVRVRRQRAAGGLVLLAGWVAACSAPPAPERRDEPAACAAPVEDVVARVHGQPLTAAELDATVQLPLYDLDRARYDLRVTRLREMLVARVLPPRALAEGVDDLE